LQPPSAFAQVSEAAAGHEALQSEFESSDEEETSEEEVEEEEPMEKTGGRRKGSKPRAVDPKRKAGKLAAPTPLRRGAPVVIELDLERETERESTPVPEQRAITSTVYAFFNCRFLHVHWLHISLTG
jgi:hypothetical protein